MAGSRPEAGVVVEAEVEDSCGVHLAAAEIEAGAGVMSAVRVTGIVVASPALSAAGSRQFGALAAVVAAGGCIQAEVQSCGHLKQFWSETFSAEATSGPGTRAQ